MPQKIRSDKDKSLARISVAQEKYANELRQKEKMYPRKSIKADQVDFQQYGSRIHELRQRKQMSLAVCAREVGMSTAMLGKLENGQGKRLNFDYLYLLCCVFDTTPDYLFGRVDGINESLEPSDGDSEKPVVLYEPINFTEKPVAHLTNEFSDTSGIFQNLYVENPELCDLLLRVIKCRDPQVRRALESAIQGIVNCFPDRFVEECGQPSNVLSDDKE